MQFYNFGERIRLQGRDKIVHDPMQNIITDKREVRVSCPSSTISANSSVTTPVSITYPSIECGQYVSDSQQFTRIPLTRISCKGFQIPEFVIFGCKY